MHCRFVLKEEKNDERKAVDKGMETVGALLPTQIKKKFHSQTSLQKLL